MPSDESLPALRPKCEAARPPTPWRAAFMPLQGAAFFRDRLPWSVRTVKRRERRAPAALSASAATWLYRSRWTAFLTGFAVLASFPTVAQDGKKSEEKLPKVVVAVPLGVVAGKTNTVEIRGLNLDTATGIAFTESGARAKVTAKGKADLPQNQKKERLGDTQVKAEVFVPAEFKGDDAVFTVETPDGKSAPARMAVLRPEATTEEVEDNGSFAKPQMVKLPTTVRGSIKAAQDVDVFAFEGKAGQRVTAEILASRLGSPLDAMLTLWNSSNTLLASADDSAGDRDPRLIFTLPADGRFFIVVQDAHDAGSAVHGYLLQLKLAERP